MLLQPMSLGSCAFAHLLAKYLKKYCINQLQFWQKMVLGPRMEPFDFERKAVGCKWVGVIRGAGIMARDRIKIHADEAATRRHRHMW